MERETGKRKMMEEKRKNVGRGTGEKRERESGKSFSYSLIGSCLSFQLCFVAAAATSHFQSISLSIPVAFTRQNRLRLK